MITKNYKKIFSIVLSLMLLLFVASCTQEENTGDSTLNPTSPTVSIALDFIEPVTLIENDSVFEYTVSLSETQLVDIKLHVSQIDGTADADDYEMTNLLTIPAGYTTAKGSIKILSDDIPEDTETLNIQIGDNRTANGDLTPIGANFTILNFEDGDLAIDLEWAMSTPTTDNSGNVIGPTDFADLRLLVSTTPDNENVIGGSDGGGFEHYVFSGSEPDGDYYVVADFYDANSEIFRDLDLQATYTQIGVNLGELQEFPAALNNASICPSNFYVMTKITKTGSDYTTEYLGINNFKNQEISYSGIDADYDSQVTTGIDCTGNVIAGLNAEWMWDFWGESIEEEGTVYWTVDGSGVVTIESQYIFTTLYSGDLYDYTVIATGTYDAITGEFYLQYYLDQDGFSPSNWAYDNGYQDTPYFEAILVAN